MTTRMTARTRPPHIYNALYTVLEEYFPDHRSVQNVLDVPGLAHDIGVSHETIYRALRYDHLKVGVALQMLGYSHDKHPEMPLYWENLVGFVLPMFKEFSLPDPAA